MARYQFSLRSLLIVTTILVVVIGVATSIGRRYSETSKRHEVQTNFRHIWTALAKYNERHGVLPPSCTRDTNGHAATSWRLLMVYEMGNSLTHSDPAEPWDDPVNRDWASRSLLVYCFASTFYSAKTQCLTNVLAVTGPNTAFDNDKRCALAHLDPDTILIVETTTSRTHWMQPGGDLDVSKLPTAGDCASAGISGNCHGGFFVAFADGEIWLLSDKTPLGTLRKFFTVKRSEGDHRDDLLAPYRLPLE